MGRTRQNDADPSLFAIFWSEDLYANIYVFKKWHEWRGGEQVRHAGVPADHVHQQAGGLPHLRPRHRQVYSRTSS